MQYIVIKKRGCHTKFQKNFVWRWTKQSGVKGKKQFSEYTVIGALAKYISTENDKFQPMNANFGILPELEGKKIKDKRERYMKLAERSLKILKWKMLDNELELKL